MKRRLFAAALLSGALGLPLGAVAAAPKAEGTTALQVVRDLPYGPDARQVIDAYVPIHATGPVLVMVHGGAWTAGDKGSPATIRPKVAYWTARGYVFVGVNYRLLPAADPLEQARDVARALALVQQQAPSWGADARRVVLMGHSSGGHLVALLAAQPQLAYQQGAKPWKGTVSLDGAALDVEELMRARHAPLYDRAFGRDPAFWQAASPAHALVRPGPPLLLVCSTLRRASCAQAQAFEAKAAAIGQRVAVLPQPRSHAEINQQLGLPGPYTDAVERWISAIL
jgi:acetyl esterase/lipase